MTFDEIVSLVATDLNLTSSDAIARIGLHVNMKYRELVALPWLQISRRAEMSQVVTIGNRYVTFSNCTKLYSVFDPNQQNQPLDEVAFDELRNQITLADPPQQYAIARQGSDTVTIFLDVTPATAYTLNADVEQKTVTLSGSQQPRFQENFHDILYYGAKYLELMKMEKGQLAQEALGQPGVPGVGYFGRLSDLKFHIAKTSYLTYQQNKRGTSVPQPINTLVS